MYSVAVRHHDKPNPGSTDRLWENTACEHFMEAKNILGLVVRLCNGSQLNQASAHAYQSIRMSTCQALLLLGHREFGIGRPHTALQIVTHQISRFHGTRLALHW